MLGKPYKNKTFYVLVPFPRKQFMPEDLRPYRIVGTSSGLGQYCRILKTIIVGPVSKLQVL